MWDILFYIWMIGFMSFAIVNFVYGDGRKWKMTYGHLLWFIIGMIFTAIPYECIIHMTK